MKNVLKLALVTAISTASITTAFGLEYTKGVVTKVDATQKKVTIKHEELTNLDMPAMTMVFRTVDDAMLEKMEEGKAIEFVADRVKGKLTVTALK